MFNGSVDLSVMGKGRVTLPSRFRKELGGKKLILSIGFEKCIFGFTEKMWETVTQPELAKPLFSDKEGRDLRRKIFSNAETVEIDKQGRFIIPERMLDYATLNEKIVQVIGAGEHIEIWNKKKWEEYRAGLA